MTILHLDDVKDDSEMSLTAATCTTDWSLHASSSNWCNQGGFMSPPPTTPTPHASMISVLGRATVSNLHTIPPLFKPPVPGH